MKKILAKHFMKLLLVLSVIVFLADGCEPVNAATVKLNKTSVTLIVGKKTTLKVKGTKRKAKWTTTNKKVCTVTQKGVVTAKKSGSAYVKAKVGKKTLRCKVKVTKYAAVKKISIKGNGNVLAPSGTMKLSVKYSPSNTRKEEIVWSSSSDYVASVNALGEVTAKNTGSVTIYAKLRSNEAISASYNIEVKNISVEIKSMGSADGGDLLITEPGASESIAFAVSDTVADVKVNVLDAVGNIIRTYNMGKLSAYTDNTCTWDLTNSYGSKVPAGNYCFQIVTAGAVTKSDYFSVYAYSEFAGGNGSPANPYQVSSVDQLKKIVSHNGCSFVQTTNFELGYGEFTSLFTSDAPFEGTYNGNGCSISNIMNSGTMDYSAIFRAVGKNGVISNLTVSSCTFSGKSYVAAMVGWNQGVIENCSVTLCTSTASGSDVGSICGYNSGKIISCSSSGNTVIGQANNAKAGGICGYNKGIINSCNSNLDNVKVTAYWDYEGIGGIAGYSEGTIAGCTVVDDTLAGLCSGGISGRNSGIVSGCTVNDEKGLISGRRKGGIVGNNAGTCTNNTYYGSLSQTG